MVAEDITARFLNVISLFSGSIPIIAIQVSALKVEDKLVLNFVKVLDSRKLRKDDSTEIKAKDTDRQYWVSAASPATVELVDRFLEIINQVADKPRQLTYNRYFIGLNDGIRPGNFVTFRPKKSILNIGFRSLSQTEPWEKRLKDSGLEFDVKDEILRIKLTPKDFDENKGLLTEIIQQCVKDYEAE